MGEITFFPGFASESPFVLLVVHSMFRAMMNNPLIGVFLHRFVTASETKLEWANGRELVEVAGYDNLDAPERGVHTMLELSSLLHYLVESLKMMIIDETYLVKD